MCSVVFVFVLAYLLLQCIGIADMIASVESEMRLYKIFKKRKHLLKILLKQIANASTKIVEGMSDPLGYYR